MSRRLFKASLGIGSIDIANKFIGLALGVVLARGLGPDGYGIYAFAMAVITLLLIPAQFGLPNLILREVATASVNSSRTGVLALMLRSAFFILLFSFLVMFAGWIVLRFWEVDFLSGRSDALMIGFLLIPALAVLNLLSEALRGWGVVVLSKLVQTLLPAVIILVVLYFFFFHLQTHKSAEFALLIRLIAMIVAIFLLIAFALKKGLLSHHTANDEKLESHLLIRAFPFLLIGSANIIMAQTDILMLGAFVDNQGVGVYRVAVNAAQLVMLPYYSVSAVLAPEFARLFAKGDIKKLESTSIFSIQAVFAITVPGVLILLFFGKFFIDILFGSGYENSYTPLLILSFGSLMAISIGYSGFLLNMTKHQNLSVKILFFVSALNIGLNFLLIPHWGMNGAAIATSISVITWLFLAKIFVRRKLKISCSIYHFDQKFLNKNTMQSFFGTFFK